VLYNYALTKVFPCRGRHNGWRSLRAHIMHVRKIHIDFKHFIDWGLDEINTLSFLLSLFLISVFLYFTCCSFNSTTFTFVFFFKVKLNTLFRYPVTQNNPQSLWFDNPYYSTIDLYYCEVVQLINLKST
jgi:hypothetical protein